MKSITVPTCSFNDGAINGPGVLKLEVRLRLFCCIFEFCASSEWQVAVRWEKKSRFQKLKSHEFESPPIISNHHRRKEPLLVPYYPSDNGFIKPSLIKLNKITFVFWSFHEDIHTRSHIEPRIAHNSFADKGEIDDVSYLSPNVPVDMDAPEE
jgi:hypothetical protein